MTDVTHTPETSVVAHMLASDDAIALVLGELVAATHFADPASRAIFAQIVDAWHEDRSTDALTIGRLTAATLGRLWDCDEPAATGRVQSLAQTARGDVLEHAQLVRRDHGYRQLTKLATELQRDISLEQDSPDELGGRYAAAATNISIGALRNREIISFEQLGQEFVNEQAEIMDAWSQGIEMGAFFGLSFMDNYTRGLQPGELFIMGGAPGAGKSGVAWKAGMNFAERQARVDEDRRMAALILSLEMGKRPSSIRLAQALAKVEGGAFREGSNTEGDLQAVKSEWGRRRKAPLFFNFTSTLKASQLRALVIEGIRRHNVGVLIIDHMRYFDMDGRYQSKLEEDEDKARFLKQSLAKDLDLAVICLAHTTKEVENSEDRKPRLAHLRGSGQIAAEADFVAFVHRPYQHASERAKAAGDVSPTEAQMVYAKNRHQPDATADFYFDASTLTIH